MSSENEEPKAPVDRLVMRCDSCRWWTLTADGRRNAANNHEDDLDGFCRRFPPVLNNALLAQEGEAFSDAINSISWFWPVTTGSDFCGEFTSA